jgi:arylsulfatase A-like enzyme
MMARPSGWVPGIAWILFALALPVTTVGAEFPRPNVLLIYIDDLDFDELAATGGNVLTPNLDRLVREGMQFDRAYVTSPVCTPSRYSLLTGRYAGRCRAFREPGPDGEPSFSPDEPYDITWNTRLRPGESTIAAVLQRSGYRTGMVGKWHLGTTPEGGYIARPRLVTVDPEDPEVNRRLWAIYEQERAYVAETYGFDFVGALHAKNPEAFLANGYPKALAVHNVDWMTDRALAFLRTEDERPFFLYYATTVPHGPSAAASMRADPRYTMAGVLDVAPAGQPPRQDVFRRIAVAQLKEPRPWQFMGMTWLDDGIGALLAEIEAMGAAENTLIIVMSDNRSDGKYTLYEDGARVPCFAVWPGCITAGAHCPDLVANIDIAATVFDVCGAEFPATPQLDGRSWRPLFDGSAAAWRTDLFLEIGYARGVVTDAWKYIAVRHPESSAIGTDIRGSERRAWDGRTVVLYDAAARFPGYFDADQLYHLSEDPHEQTNLAGRGTYARQLADLRTRLQRYLRTFRQPFGELEAAPGESR